MTMIAATCDNLLVRAGSWPRQALLVLAGSVLLWISAKVQVPFWPVPMTLQTLAVLGLAAALGRRLGVAAVVLYLMEGALGLPVFAGTPEKGIGLAYMAGPTGGYLAGFVLAAFIVGTLAERGLTKRLAPMFAIMLAGAAVIYLPGVAWLAQFVGFENAIAFGVTPFILGDVAKAAIAALAFPAAWSLLGRR